jgi:hypothetical protein
VLASLAAMVLLALAIATGCTVQSAPPPPAASATPTPTASTSAPATYPPALCAAAAEVQAAANGIVHLNALQVGTDGVKAALQNLQTAGQHLATAAKDQFGPQAVALQQSLTQLAATIGSLSDQASLSANLGAITAAVSGVEQSAQPIVDNVRGGCPGLPPSETPRPS